MAFEVDAIVDVRVHRDELLQRLHPSESEHRPLASPEGQVAVFHPVVRRITSGTN
jgi:hypothetical protein